MKTRLLYFLLSLGSLATAWGQAATPDVGNPWKELWTSLAPLNPVRIPTGVLLNRTVLITNPHRYAGQGDTVASYNTFEQQYWEFFHAALGYCRAAHAGCPAHPGCRSDAGWHGAAAHAQLYV